MLAVNSDGLVDVVLKEISKDDIVSKKFTPHNEFFEMHCTWIGVVSHGFIPVVLISQNNLSPLSSR